MALGDNINNESDDRKTRRKKRRWGEAVKTEAPPTVASSSGGASAPAIRPDEDPQQAKIRAMQESVKARLAAAKAKLKRPMPVEATAAPLAKKAKVYELDIAQTSAPPTSISNKTVAAAKPKPSNPYLSHRSEEEEEEVEDETIDPSLVGAVEKQRKRHKELNFVEPGKYQELAELKREREARAAAAGFLSGRKQGHTLTAVSIITAADITDTDSMVDVPRADAHPETKMPVAIEWWDTDLLPSNVREQVAAEENKLLLKQSKAALKVGKSDDENAAKEGSSEDSLEALRQRCYAEAKLENSRTSSLVQHIVPIRKLSKQRKPVLHLTKKELKRQRKLRRQEKQQKLQDLQAAGLVEAPEPRLTLSNFIKVLGDQAYLDPSQMERKVQEQMEARQRAHLTRNAANKLTKEQRNAKLARKYEDDGTIETCIFFVRDISHNYHRAKLDTNAQQFLLTGCVLELPGRYACVVVEGSPKAIQKFSRLLLVRMQWNGEDFPKDNLCEKVWQGIVPKRIFKGFLFQTAESEDQARKILKTKGVEHYWNQTADHASGKMSGIRLKLVGDDHADNDNPFKTDKGEDDHIVMK